MIDLTTSTNALAQRIRRVLRSVCLCLITLASSVAGAQTVYTVAVQDIDYYPIYRTSFSDGHYDGYLRDMLDAFAREHDIRFIYKPRPIRRGAAEFLGGQHDFILPAHPQWNHVAKAGKRVYYSRPLVYFEDAVLTPPAQKDITLAQMRRYGTIHGFTPWKFADRIDEGGLKVETARTPENLIRMAIRGRVDAINLAMPVASYHLDRLGLEGRLVPANQLIDIKRSRYHLATLKHPEVIEALDRFLTEPPAELANVVMHYEKYGLVGPMEGDWPQRPGQRRSLARPKHKALPNSE